MSHPRENNENKSYEHNKIKRKKLNGRKKYFSTAIISKGLIFSKMKHILKINKTIIKIPMDKWVKVRN